MKLTNLKKNILCQGAAFGDLKRVKAAIEKKFNLVDNNNLILPGTTEDNEFIAYWRYKYNDNEDWHYYSELQLCVKFQLSDDNEHIQVALLIRTYEECLSGYDEHRAVIKYYPVNAKLNVENIANDILTIAKVICHINQLLSSMNDNEIIMVRRLLKY